MNQAILNNKSFIQKKLMENRVTLEHAKMVNEEYQKLNNEKQRVESLLNDIKSFTSDLNLILTAIDQEDIRFKTDRIQFLNDVISLKINEVFGLDYEAKISFDDRYNSMKASLSLLDKYGNVKSPDIAEGKLMQYTVGFSAAMGIMESLGSRIMYIDEAFGVAGEDILTELGQVLQAAVDSGLQIIMVSQRAGLYEDLPRVQFTLEKEKAETFIHNVVREEFGMDQISKEENKVC